MQEHDVHIRWKNFRSFRDTRRLRIKPLTILIGPNNAGKTSVLAPLLLLNQTLTSRDADRALITRGDLVDVGSYGDLIHHHDTSLPLSLEIGFIQQDKPQTKSKKMGDYPPGALEVTFDHSQEVDIRLRNYRVFDIFRRLYLRRTRYKSNRYLLGGHIKTKDMSRQERAILRSHKPTNFFFSPSTVQYLQPRRKSSDGDSLSETGFSSHFTNYLITIGYTYSALRGFFYPLSYLGPIRAWPRRYYKTLSEKRLTVGTKGEYTAAVLHSNEDIWPKVDAWVDKFGFGKKIKISKLTDDLLEIGFVDESGNKTNIADVGFGASQLLPLIVQALAIEKEAIFVAEQPEIHLNPRLQGTLADLFVDVVKAGKRVVLETHSEHLLIRLRRLVAEGRISPEQVALYFVERKGGYSTIREVPIQENGHILPDEWPKEFFQDALRESLALATAQANRSSE